MIDFASLDLDKPESIAKAADQTEWKVDFSTTALFSTLIRLTVNDPLGWLTSFLAMTSKIAFVAPMRSTWRTFPPPSCWR
jgi:hypothetical protein